MIGAFVGSFNPITYAHLLIAQGIVNTTDVSKVVFVPVSDSYEKNSLRVESEDRLAMISLAIEGNPNLEVNALEIEIAGQTGHQNKTIETLQMLSEQYQEEIALIIGADNVLSLHKWYRAEELAKTYPFLVIPRDGLDLKKEIQADAWLSEHLKRYEICTVGKCEMSSTMIRNWVKEGIPITYYVCPKVEEYIRIKGLYKEEDA